MSPLRHKHLGTAAINYDKKEDAIARSIAKLAAETKVPVSFTVSTTTRHRGNEAMHYNSFYVRPTKTSLELHRFDSGVGRWDGMTKEISTWVTKSIKPKGKKPVVVHDHSVPLQKCTKDHMCQSWSMAWLLDADVNGLEQTDRHYSSLAEDPLKAMQHMQSWLEFWNKDPEVAYNLVLDIMEKHDVSESVAKETLKKQIADRKFRQMK